MTDRDIPFDEHTPDAPAHVIDNFADIRPLAEVEAMRRKWADNLDRACGRQPIAGGRCPRCGAPCYGTSDQRCEHL